MQQKNIVLKGVASLLLYFGVTRVVASLIVFILYKTKYDNLPTSQSSVDSTILTTAMFASLLITLLILFTINYRELWNNIKVNIRNVNTYLYTLIMLGVYFITMMIVGIILMLLDANIVDSENQQAIVGMFDDSNKLIIFATLVILAPIVEEIVFRYSLINVIEVLKLGKIAKVLPYMLSALIFALIHDTTIFTDFNLTSFGIFIRYFAPSLVLAIAYMISKRNIVTVILIHLIINLISTLAQFLM